LLIITDGVLDEFDLTVDEIINASSQPLSIIIIGVGNSVDFTRMETLDGDGDKPLTSRDKRRVVSRDIVQFIA
jgi:hypothetical protein